MKALLSVADRHTPDTAGLAQIAKYLALGNSNRAAAAHLAEIAGAPTRVQNVLKAAVPAGNTESGWGAELVDNQILVSAFIGLMRSSSAFYRLLDIGAIRVPFNTRVGFVVQGVTAWLVGEGKPVPVSGIGIDNLHLERSMVAAMVVMTEELLKATQSDAVVTREMRRGVAAVVDNEFFDLVTDGSTPTVASTGSDADAILHDIGALMAAVAPTVESKLLWVMSVRNAMAASLLTTLGGSFLFPGLTPFGGEIRGIPVVVSDGISEDTVALIDATGIAAETENISIEASNDTTVEMSDTPADPPSGGSIMVSMFQTNSVAILAKAYFGAQRVRDNAVALLTGVNWGGDTPES